MNFPVIEANIYATIRIHIQEATIEVDDPFISISPSTSNVGAETTMISKL